MKSFLGDRSTVITAKLALGEPTEHSAGLSRLRAAAVPAGEEKLAATPVVQCVKEGALIKKIIVTCGCGKVVEIECDYPVA